MFVYLDEGIVKNISRCHTFEKIKHIVINCGVSRNFVQKELIKGQLLIKRIPFSFIFNKSFFVYTVLLCCVSGFYPNETKQKWFSTIFG